MPHRPSISALDLRRGPAAAGPRRPRSRPRPACRRRWPGPTARAPPAAGSSAQPRVGSTTSGRRRPGPPRSSSSRAGRRPRRLGEQPGPVRSSTRANTVPSGAPAAARSWALVALPGQRDRAAHRLQQLVVADQRRDAEDARRPAGRRRRRRSPRRPAGRTARSTTGRRPTPRPRRTSSDRSRPPRIRPVEGSRGHQQIELPAVDETAEEQGDRRPRRATAPTSRTRGRSPPRTGSRPPSGPRRSPGPPTGSRSPVARRGTGPRPAPVPSAERVHVPDRAQPGDRHRAGDRVPASPVAATVARRVRQARVGRAQDDERAAVGCPDRRRRGRGRATPGTAGERSTAASRSGGQAARGPLGRSRAGGRSTQRRGPCRGGGRRRCTRRGRTGRARGPPRGGAGAACHRCSTAERAATPARSRGSGTSRSGHISSHGARRGPHGRVRPATSRATASAGEFSSGRHP